MRDVAREMNLSETAFVIAQDGGYNLRWFTPSVEVDLCGHATVASAHVLWEDGHLPRGQQARFHTRCGLLTAGQQETGSNWTFRRRSLPLRRRRPNSSPRWE